jgi:hypothetical protein
MLFGGHLPLLAASAACALRPQMKGCSCCFTAGAFTGSGITMQGLQQQVGCLSVQHVDCWCPAFD